MSAFYHPDAHLSPVIPAKREKKKKNKTKKNQEAKGSINLGKNMGRREKQKKMKNSNNVWKTAQVKKEKTMKIGRELGKWIEMEKS